jgi:Tfp pilus assembly protein PilO
MANKNEIKFEQPSDLLVISNRYIVVIMSLLVFAILMLGYFFLLKPKMVSNEARQEQSKKNIASQEASERLLASLGRLESEYKNIQANRQADLEQLKKILPTNPQVAEIFVLAEKLALDNGLKLNSVDIAVDNNLNTEKSSASTVLKSLPLRFSLTRISNEEMVDFFPEGSILPFDPNVDDYSLFKNYIATLEKNLRLMDIQTLSLPALSTDPDHNMPSFNFSVITYYR